ncbi:MAG: glycosyltransferase [Solirubrobacterales bacterium]|nr:glycosyltransferase [Solirubrobacterales bacterium]
MIAFGCSITRPDLYRECAQPGIRLAAESDSAIYEFNSKCSLFEAYNQILDLARAAEDLEALVLVHQDTELVDSDFCSRIRKALEDPEVAVVGCAGAVSVRSIAWWEGSVVTGSFLMQYPERGGGTLPSFSWEWEDAPAYARTGEVESIDGFMLVLSPWAIENLRFDESLGQLDGYDFDICLQARVAGRKVVTADVRAIHHRPLVMLKNHEGWIDAHIAVANKWEGVVEGVGAGTGSWKERALLAEAQADAVLYHARVHDIEREARVTELDAKISAARKSIAWRLTQPFRLIGGRR